MLCLAEKSRMEIHTFVIQFSEGKLGVRNDVLGMKSWSMITNRRGEKRRKSLRNQHKSLVAYQECCTMGEESFKELWMLKRITFKGIECVFLSLGLFS